MEVKNLSFKGQPTGFEFEDFKASKSSLTQLVRDVYELKNKTLANLRKTLATGRQRDHLVGETTAIRENGKETCPAIQN